MCCLSWSNGDAVSPSLWIVVLTTDLKYYFCIKSAKKVLKIWMYDTCFSCIYCMCICTLCTLNVYVYLFDSIVKSPLISNAVLLNEPSKEVHNDTTIVENENKNTLPRTKWIWKVFESSLIEYTIYDFAIWWASSYIIIVPAWYYQPCRNMVERNPSNPLRTLPKYVIIFLSKWRCRQIQRSWCPYQRNLDIQRKKQCFWAS